MKRRCAFSMVELLVVIAVIGILVALIIPAVQSARESARRTKCLNNLKQIGIALHNYHEQFKVFPPSMIWAGPPGEPITMGTRPIGLVDRIALGVAPGTEPDRVYANWLILLLPALEQGALAGQYDSRKPVADDANANVRRSMISALSCPTDTYNRSDNTYRRDILNDPATNEYARGNYAMNFGPGRGCLVELDMSCTEGFHVDDTDLINKNMRLWGSGIGGVNMSFSSKDMLSGMSNVIGVDEIRAGVSADDPRGTWALGFVGASATARHGLVSGNEDAQGPNNVNESADDIVGCQKLRAQFTAQGLIQLGMPCYATSPPVPEINDQATSRSQHPNGVQVLLMDGAARFVSDGINPEVWYQMHRRDSDVAQSLGF